MRKYSGLDPETQVGQDLLKVNFVTKSWPDIAKKLQNLSGWNEKPKEELEKLKKCLLEERLEACISNC